MVCYIINPESQTKDFRGHFIPNRLIDCLMIRSRSLYPYSHNGLLDFSIGILRIL